MLIKTSQLINITFQLSPLFIELLKADYSDQIESLFTLHSKKNVLHLNELNQMNVS